MPDFVEELEALSRARFVRWDPETWQALVEGPARDLAAALAAGAAPGGPGAPAEAILRSYLRLAAEAIGLGYLYPASAGADAGFFHLAWTRLLPRSLPPLEPARQAELLAACWNLGENLELAPVWLRRIFTRVCRARDSLADLPALVADVERLALAPPPHALTSSARTHWIHLAAEDPRFLPGRVHFVAPTVACVHDRPAADGAGAAPSGRASSLGVWMVDPPLVLGPMGCDEPPGGVPRAELDEPSRRILDGLARHDPRAAEHHDAAVNAWCAAVTLETSQFLVGLLPAPEGEAR